MKTLKLFGITMLCMAGSAYFSGLEFPSDGGERSIHFTSSVKWVAKVSYDDNIAKEWCTVGPTSGGAGDNTIYIKTKSIGALIPTSVNITISIKSILNKDLFQDINLKVTQYPYVTVFSMKDAGILPSLISNQIKDNVRELVLMGFINGTDVKLLREMVLNGKLSKLDLTGVKVVEGGDNYFSNS